MRRSGRTVRWGALACLACLGWAGSADYQPQPEPPATSLGVLIDPALTLPEQLAQPLRLADKPGGALQTYSAGDLAYLETDYEQARLLIYAQQPGWWGVTLREATAGSALRWLPAQAGQHWQSYASLLSAERLRYPTAAWDGRLAKRAGGLLRAQTSLPPASGLQFDLLGQRERFGQTWFHIAIRANVCTHGEASPVLARGWLPLRRRDGALNLWYYPRGC